MDGYFVPIADIIDTPDNILVEIELPGLVKNDESISIELTNGLLEIKGEIKDERITNEKNTNEKNTNEKTTNEKTTNEKTTNEIKYIVKERTRGRFKKQIPLNHEISEHDINAKLQNGILYIKIKKIKSKNPNLIHKINILG